MLWCSPGLVAGVVGLYLLLGAGLSRGLGKAVAATLQDFAPVSEGRVLAVLMDLTMSHPSHLGQLGALLESSALLGLLTWTVLVGGVIVALDRSLRGPELVAAAVRHLPGIVVVSLWHFALRAGLLTAVGLLVLVPGVEAPALAKVVPLLANGLLLLALGFSACALDLARVMVVVEEQRGLGPAIAWRAFRRAGRNPRLLASSLLLSILRWLLLLLTVAVAIAAFGQPWSPWAVRGLAALAVVCGLARLAITVAHCRHTSRSPGGGSERTLSVPAVEAQQAKAEVVPQPSQQQARNGVCQIMPTGDHRADHHQQHRDPQHDAQPAGQLARP